MKKGPRWFLSWGEPTMVPVQYAFLYFLLGKYNARKRVRLSIISFRNYGELAACGCARETRQAKKIVASNTIVAIILFWLHINAARAMQGLLEITPHKITPGRSQQQNQEYEAPSLRLPRHGILQAQALQPPQLKAYISRMNRILPGRYEATLAGCSSIFFLARLSQWHISVRIGLIMW